MFLQARVGAVIAMTIGALSALSAAASETVTEPIRQFGVGLNGRAVAFHPIKLKVVLSTSEGAVIVDSNTSLVLTQLSGHTDIVGSVAFSPDGAQVVTGSRDTTAGLWDAATGDEIRWFEGHTSSVTSVAFSPDGTQVLTGSVDNTARLWDAATGDEIRSFEGHMDSVSSVAFSPNGTQLLTGQGSRARLWDAQTGNEIRVFEGHTSSVLSVAFSPDGKQVLTGSWDNTARLWDTATGTEIRSFLGHTSAVRSVAFSPDGTQVLTGAGRSELGDFTARLWNAATGDEIRSFEGHTEIVQSVVFSPNGAHVLTSSSDSTAKLWDADSGTLVHSITKGHTDTVHSVAFSPDGAQVLTGSRDKTAKLWDPDTGEEIRPFDSHEDSVTSVAFSPDGAQVLTGLGYSRGKTAKLWDKATGEEIRSFEGHTSVIQAVAFSPDGTQVLTGSGDRTVRLWDSATGVEIRRFEGHNGTVSSVAFSPDGTQVLTGAFDNTARLWDTATGAQIRSFEGHTGWVHSVAFSPDGTQVLTGSGDHTARLWDTATGTEIRSFLGHTASVSSVAFSPNGALVLTGGANGDNKARLWGADTGNEIRAFKGHTRVVNSVVFSPDGTHVLTGSGDTTAMLWEIPAVAFAVSPDDLGPTNADEMAFAVRFTRPVVNFGDAADVIITHDGTAHTGVTFTGGPKEYSVTVEGITGDGSFTLAVSTASNIESSSGNPLESSVTSEPVIIDNTPPLASIISDFGNGPGQDFTTSISTFQLEGMTDPDTVEVRVNGEAIAYTPGLTTWSALIDLAELGPIVDITIVTIDEAGNESEPVSITITYDPLNDADGNGLTDQEEWEIREVIPTDPLDPLLPRSDWFVSAATGNNIPAIDGGGSEEKPWRTIQFAMQQLTPLVRIVAVYNDVPFSKGSYRKGDFSGDKFYGRKHTSPVVDKFPLRILLDDSTNFTDDVGAIALYEEQDLAFIPFVTVEPANLDGGRIHIRPSTTGTSPVIRAAAYSTLRGVVVRPALAPDQARALLEVNNVPFTVEGVTFDGLLRQNSTGIDISGLASSDSLITQSQFLNLGTGIRSTNSAVAVSDNTFQNISANSSSSVAIAIGFTVLPTKQGVGQTPVLGRADRILETGFNRFRGLPSGASAIEFVNVPVGITSAQYNDWGVYTEELIRGRISTPFKDGGANAVDIFPFIPQDKPIGAGGITGVILDAKTNAPIPSAAAPGVFASQTLFAMADADGLFIFPELPTGTYSLFGRALNYPDSPLRSVLVAADRITAAPRILLLGDGTEPGVPGDINGDGQVNAVDVQLVTNAALGIDIGSLFNADINGDGVVNAVDVQLVINAALGIEINP